MKKILALVAASLISATAHADLIDFTDAAVSGADGDTPMSLSGFIDGTVGWTISNFQDAPLSITAYDGNPMAATSGCDVMACTNDGVGIGLGDDEVGDGSQTFETLKLAFDQKVTISAFHFLDLFTGNQSEELTIYNVDTNETFTATAPDPSNAGGYFLFEEEMVGTEFTLFAEFDDDFKDDGNNDFALAGVQVSAVPVPAALPLMASALGMFGIARRRKA